MHKLRHFIKSTPGLAAIAQFILRPRQEIASWRDFSSFQKRFSPILGVPRPKSYSGKILVISFHGNFVAGVKEEALLVKAAQMFGLEPYIVTSRGSWATRYYRVFGVDHFIYFESFLPSMRTDSIQNEIKSAIGSLRTIDDLMGFEYEGVKVGKYICSSFVRKTYTGDVRLDDPAIRSQMREYLMAAMQNTLAAKAIYDRYRPSAVLFLERGYTPYGEFFDTALNYGIDTIQWCCAHRNNALILKRYHRGIDDEHPVSLSGKTWEQLKAMPWSKEKEGASIIQELFKNYASGEWFSEVGTQFNSRMLEKAKVREIIGLDPRKKTAIIFPHLFWDATFFWGKDIFMNYREWFLETVKAACANQNLNWVIKIHPANIVKLNRDGYRGQLVEKLTIQEAIGKLPPHVKILEPDTVISTYSLFQVMDYCLTVRGTIGIEAAIFGITVLTAGTGRYDRHGFTIDSLTREDYLDKLARLHTFRALTASQTELAQRFAYGTFIARPFPLKSIRISYNRDKKATPEVKYLFNAPEEVAKAPDIRAFGEWLLHSKDEDYINI